MKFKDGIKNIKRELKISSKRFPTSTVCISLFFIIYSVYTLLSEKINETIYSSLLFALFFGILLSILITLLFESRDIKISKLISQLIPIPFILICYFIVSNLINNKSNYLYMGYFGLIFTFIALILYFLFDISDDTKEIFPHLFKTSIFAFSVSSVFMFGLCICIGAFDALIYSGLDMGKVYMIISAFCYEFIFLILFLAYIPSKEYKYTIPKVYKLLINKIAFPIYMVLVGILYVYLIKIIVMWQMPVGRLNWYASFILLFYVFFYFNALIEEDKIYKKFISYGGILIVPILIMQLIAIYIRLKAYGLTTMRFISLALILIGVFFIINSIIKKDIKWVFVASGIVIILITLTPFNIIDIPNKSQENILKEVLIKNDMYKNGKIIKKQNISDKDKVKITSCYNYLSYQDSKKSDFVKLTTKKDMKRTFGFDEFDESDLSEGNEEIECMYSGKDLNNFNITPYTHVKSFSFYGRDNKEFTVKYKIKDYCFKLYRQYGRNNSLDSDILVYKPDSNTKIYLTNINFTLSKDKTKITNINYEGYIFSK